jgi:hypothetical protein
MSAYKKKKDKGNNLYTEFMFIDWRRTPLWNIKSLSVGQRPVVRKVAEEEGKELGPSHGHRQKHGGGPRGGGVAYRISWRWRWIGLGVLTHASLLDPPDPL